MQNDNLVLFSAVVLMTLTFDIALQTGWPLFWIICAAFAAIVHIFGN